ncbi:MAG: hypothetical protein ACREQI_11090 [Candidatus Binataceae bacterium]
MKTGRTQDHTETLKRAHRGLQAWDGFLRRSQLIAQPLSAHAPNAVSKRRLDADLRRTTDAINALNKTLAGLAEYSVPIGGVGCLAAAGAAAPLYSRPNVSAPCDPTDGTDGRNCFRGSIRKGKYGSYNDAYSDKERKENDIRLGVGDGKSGLIFPVHRDGASPPAKSDINLAAFTAGYNPEVRLVSALKSQYREVQ